MNDIRTKTAETLLKMYQENTGKSLLDSGGAYGRNWERNQTKTLDDFLSYTGTVDCEYEMVTVSGFLTALNHLWVGDETEQLTRDFREWVEAQPIDEAYFNSASSVEEWLESLGVTVKGGWNSYNWDTLIDSTFQAIEFEMNHVEFIALSYHGGADVRGGYTDFVIFYNCECFAYAMTEVSIWCKDCDNYADIQPGYTEWNLMNPDIEWNGLKDGCAECQSKNLEVGLIECHQ
jgi:hypothetical protein